MFSVVVHLVELVSNHMLRWVGLKLVTMLFSYSIDPKKQWPSVFATCVHGPKVRVLSTSPTHYVARNVRCIFYFKNYFSTDVAWGFLKPYATSMLVLKIVFKQSFDGVSM